MNKATSPTGWARNPDGSQGYTWNPITGCLNHDNGLCKGGSFPCYAYKLANGRVKPLYLGNPNCAGYDEENMTARQKIDILEDPFYPRFWEERLIEPYNKETRWGSRRRYTQRAKGIFVCDMSDLFGIGVPEEWTRRVMTTIRDCPQHRFYLLTKQPQNLIKFSPFPDNCFVGVTATTKGRAWEADKFLDNIEAKVKFLSLEPLLDWSPADFGGSFLENDSHINWLIIGACTGTKKEMTNLARNNSSFLSEMPWGKKWTAQPNPDWVREIVEAADQARIKVFLKDNLRPLLEHDFKGIKGVDGRYAQLVEGIWQLRQEMPI